MQLLHCVYPLQKFKGMAALAGSQTVPTSPLDAQVLNCGYTSGLGDWEELIEYGLVRYHLVLEINQDEQLCDENELLYKLGEACSNGNDEEIDHWAERCRVLIWPLIVDDYTLHKDGPGFRRSHQDPRKNHSRSINASETRSLPQVPS